MHIIEVKFLKKDNIKILSRIAEHGCVFNCVVHRNIKEVLCRQIGIPINYLKNRIQTIFINGKVIDNYEETTVYDKDKITLSTAMPGLVGAMLRNKGVLSSMRSSISSKRLSNKKENLSDKTKIVMGSIVLKLFNLVSKELSSLILNPNRIVMNTIESIYLFKNISIF